MIQEPGLIITLGVIIAALTVKTITFVKSRVLNTKYYEYRLVKRDKHIEGAGVMTKYIIERRSVYFSTSLFNSKDFASSTIRTKYKPLTYRCFGVIISSTLTKEKFPYIFEGHRALRVCEDYLSFDEEVEARSYFNFLTEFIKSSDEEYTIISKRYEVIPVLINDREKGTMRSGYAIFPKKNKYKVYINEYGGGTSFAWYTPYHAYSLEVARNLLSEMEATADREEVIIEQ